MLLLLVAGCWLLLLVNPCSSSLLLRKCCCSCWLASCKNKNNNNIKSKHNNKSKNKNKNKNNTAVRRREHQSFAASLIFIMRWMTNSAPNAHIYLIRTETFHTNTVNMSCVSEKIGKVLVVNAPHLNVHRGNNHVRKLLE
jgi:hypothetical protein